MIKFKQQLNKSGFSLIETLVYIFITAMLLAVISNLLMANFNIRRQLKASNMLYNDARFIIGQLNNKLHSVPEMTDLRPAPEQIIFKIDETSDFSLQVENDNLIYRETAQVGGGTPEDLILNSTQIKVSDLVLTPVNDAQANPNRGILVNFNLSTGDQSDIYGYLNEDFETFISLR
jgi:hypothetical protein